MVLELSGEAVLAVLLALADSASELDEVLVEVEAVADATSSKPLLPAFTGLLAELVEASLGWLAMLLEVGVVAVSLEPCVTALAGAAALFLLDLLLVAVELVCARATTPMSRATPKTETVFFMPKSLLGSENSE